MNSVRIYLAGGMSGLSFEEQRKWRLQVRDAILYSDFDYEIKPIFFDPTQYYNFEEPPAHKSEREAMDFDLYNLRKSGLVIVNFNSPNSIGTAMELMLARELKIPVVGLNANNKELHPWIVECCTRICDDMYELIEHVAKYYLN